MAGILTVVNPRRRRRRNKRRRASSHRKVAKRRRVHARAANPIRRRRRSHRKVNARRRRHRNPIMGGGGTSGIMKGVTLGLGMIGAEVATNAVNNLLGANKQSGIGKIALKAGLGFAAPMVLKFVPGAKKFAGPLAVGIGLSIAWDLYQMYLVPSLPASLKDYQYGSLDGWAPQAGVADYQYGSLNGSGSAYGEGAYGGGDGM